MPRCLIVLALLGVVSCGGSPTAPRPAQIAGGWSGTFESNYSPEAMFMDLTQVTAAVTGTWLMTSGVQARGNITGTGNASQFTGTVTYNYINGPTCQASFSGDVSDTSIAWTSPGFTGNCGLIGGNPTSVRFVLQRR